MKQFLAWLTASPDNLTAFGTIFAAVVTAVLAGVTLFTTSRQIRRERGEKKPNLILTNVGNTQAYVGTDGFNPSIFMFRVHFEVANLSSQAVYVKEVELIYRSPLSAPSKELNFSVKSGETAARYFDLSIPIDAPEGGGSVFRGRMNLYFHYAPTGRIFHKLFVPYEAYLAENLGDSRLKLFREEQGWEPNVEIPSKNFESFTERSNRRLRFWQPKN